MKVLVISLLRMGDLLMQKPLLDKLAASGHQIHLLMNAQFEGVTPVLADVVKKFHYFDRESYQRSAGEAHFNIFYGVQKIDALLDQLNEEEFDAIYNFTHNRLSAILTGAIRAGVKKGCHYNSGSFQGFDSPWIRYFNTHFSAPRGSVFHYTELLGKAFSIPASPIPVRTGVRNEGLILMQCFTSDAKKNWPLQNFKQLKNEIEKRHPYHLVRVLAAPNEVKALKEHFQDIDIWEADLQTAQWILQEAGVFVGLDTSIKHLAALVGTPVVEICLGGSDVAKTSAFQEGALSVMANVACAPCGHSEACPQKSHLCAEDVSVMKVVEQVSRQIAGVPVEADVDREADRIVWETYLEGSSQGKFAPTPSYMARTLRLLEWQLRLEKALSHSHPMKLREKVDKNDVSQFILIAQEILKSKQDKAAYFLSLTDALIHTPPEGGAMFNALEKALSESRQLLKIRSDLTIGVRDASYDRKIFEAGA